MSQRVQVILNDKEASEFKAQAIKESKSLSAWLRSAGKKMIDMNKKQSRISDVESLKIFFQQINDREQGIEPDWEENKRLILEGYKGIDAP